ncbi:Cna B-type domain-containing protein [Clostridiales Family XIII bacterium WCA-MUC-591-APC-4B]|uniref:Cna B-type domain-containing protein n=2 Tax=Mogibacterium TaxID=86331 RepID=A0A6N7XJV0_9FIRM|nr:Cna B-type domain-containing protein [Mogibacterium kristiansenii]
MGNKILRRATLWLLVLFAVFCFAPFSSSADDGYDAHFFIRYDSSTQKEDGTTQYSPKHYFPVGTTAPDYVYGNSGSDYTSVDGKVLTKVANVPGAEKVITGGNVNLYDSFGTEANTEALHKYFKTVYDNILQEPSRDVIQASIEKALGAKYATLYAKGEIDVLWYVSKAESSYVNVDGVVYYVKTGQVVDKPETDRGTVEIDGIKNLKGRNFKKGDSWNFAIQADTDDAPMPEKTTARIQSEDGAVEYFTFGEIHFTRADLKGSNSKTFRYTITESGSVANVTNDSASHTVNVTVSYDRNKSKLSAKAEYLNGGKSGSSAEFNNEYHKPVTRVQVEKVWSDSNDRSRMRPESITIHLLRNGEEIKTKTVTEADDWKWTFDNLDKFDANDKEYKYTIKEDTVPFYTSAESTDADGNTVITNTYKPEKLELKGDAALKVTKVVIGKKSTEPFTFKLTAAENYGDAVKMPANTEVKTSDSIPADGAETKSFQPVEITKAGTYKFKVKETTTTTAGGWNYDNRERTLTVKVADNKGHLEVVDADSTLSATVTNTFTPAVMDADTAITGRKTLVGRNMLKDEEFNFTLKAGDAATRKAIDEKDIVLGSTNARVSTLADGSTTTFMFGRAEFSKEGEYTFIVTEKDGGKPGMKYDTEGKVLKVKVSKEDGVLKAVQMNSPSCKNVYEAAGEYTPAGTKTLLNENGNKLSVKDGQFEFNVYYSGHEDREPVTTGTTGSGKDAPIHFGTLSYTISDLEKLVAKGYADKKVLANGAEYSINYAVTEKETGNSALQQNTQTQTFRVVVKDNGTGKLTVESGTGKKLNFENIYKSDKATVNFEGQKVLEGRKLNADEFTFHVTSDDENAPMPEQTEVKNKANGRISFGTVTYGKDDLGDATEKTFTYKVKESGNRPGVANDTETKTVKVTVKDDGKGHITAETDPKTAPLFTFNNTYSTTSQESSVTGQVQIKKALAGRSMEEGEFHFVLKNEEGKTLDNAVNDKDGNITFKKLTFKNVGTYNYTVEEVAGKDSHITYDATPYKVSAVVTDNLDGTLKVTWTSGTGAILFKNTYTVDPTDATPSVEKKIAGGNPAKDSTFRFTLTGKDNAPMPKGSVDGEKTETITGEGQTDFGKITFTRAGTYTYKVTEKLGNEASYNYDSTEYTLTYKVADVRGELKAEQSITAGGKSADSIVFTNEYAPASMEGDAAITGTKELVGRSMQKDEKFEFTLKAGDEATQKAIDEKDIVLDDTNASLSGMKDGEKATFSFGRAEFSKEGEYTFTVTEKDGGKAGMTYDTKEKTFKVKVAKVNGIMTAVQEETPAFRNTYEAAGEYTPEGTKTLLSEKKNKLTIKAGEFKFSVYYAGHEDQKPVTTGVTTSGKDAAIHFAPLSYTVSDLEKLVAKGYAAKTAKDDGAEYSINYVVTENAADNSALQQNTQSTPFRVVVKDNGGGKLSVESGTGKKLDFENEYKSEKAAVSFEGLKVLEGRKLNADEFTFHVTSDDENAPMPEQTEVKNKANGRISFGTVTYGKDDLGDETEKTFTYKVKESGNRPGVANDTETKTVKVTVKDDGKGHITAETDPKTAPLFAFNNTYSTKPMDSAVTGQVQIKKALAGRSMEEGEFHFVLKNEEGKTLDNAVNDKDGNITFKKLTFKNVGTYNYTVEEVAGNDRHITYDATPYKVSAVVTDNLDGTLKVTWKSGTGAILFKNTYTVDPTDATPSVEKKIAGGNPAKDSTFRFTLTGKDNAPMPEGSKDGKKSTSVTGEGKADFGKITFDKAGTYTYKVAEENGNESSYNYDSNEYTLIYKVKDVKGELKAEQSITAGDKSADEMVFTNEYAPASMEGDAAITGTKELVGRSMQKDEKFEFTLKAGDEATQKAIDEKDIVLDDTNASLSGMRDGQKSTFSFGRAEFSKEGEYTFTVTEKDGGKAGMTYDTKEKTFKVNVAKVNGIMTAVQEETPTFKNVYEASGEFTPAGTKTLLSENGNKLSVKDNQFKFSVYYTGHTDGEAVTTGTTGNGKDAEIGFGKLSYTISDLEKLVAKGYADKAELDNGARYYIDYVVIENASENNALQANTQAPTFRVEVTDNGDGTLRAESEEGSKLAFENLYKSDKATVHLNGQKVLEGRPLKADEFTFNVTSDEENAPMPEKTEVKNEEGGNIDFGTITYGKDDLGDATEKTFTYQVKESGEQPGVANDTGTKTVKVTVKDDGKGHITAETEPKEAPLFAFNNTYSTTSKESSVTDTVKIRKTLTGRKLKNKEFTFVLKDKDGKNVAEAKNNADGSIAFKSLTFDEVGTYNYTVKEVKGNAKRVSYDANAYQVTATVTDNLDGTLSVKWSTGTKKEIHFYNRYKKKTVTPNPSGKHGGKADNNNIGPFTGDDSNADLYLGLMGASAAILAALAGSRKKRKL